MQLRKETGDETIQTEQERQARPFSEILSESLLRPLVMLCTEPIMTFFSLYLCLIYGASRSFHSSRCVGPDLYFSSRRSPLRVRFLLLPLFPSSLTFPEHALSPQQVLLRLPRSFPLLIPLLKASD